MIWSLSAWLVYAIVKIYFFFSLSFKTKFSIKCEFFKAKQPFLNSTRITRTFPFLPFLKSNFRIDFRESRKSLFHGPNAILQISYAKAPPIAQTIEPPVREAAQVELLPLSSIFQTIAIIYIKWAWWNKKRMAFKRHLKNCFAIKEIQSIQLEAITAWCQARQCLTIFPFLS